MLAKISFERIQSWLQRSAFRRLKHYFTRLFLVVVNFLLMPVSASVLRSLIPRPVDAELVALRSWLRALRRLRLPADRLQFGPIALRGLGVPPLWGLD